MHDYMLTLAHASDRKRGTFQLEAVSKNASVVGDVQATSGMCSTTLDLGYQQASCSSPGLKAASWPNAQSLVADGLNQMNSG